MSYLGGKKLGWGNANYFERTQAASSSPYLNYSKWSTYSPSPDYTYAYAITASTEDNNYSSTTDDLKHRIWRESDVVGKMNSDGSNQAGDGYVIQCAHGYQNYIDHDGVMSYLYNSTSNILSEVIFISPFNFFHFGAYSNITMQSQNNSIFYFELFPSTSNPSGYNEIKTFHFKWSDYIANTTASARAAWFINLIQTTLGISESSYIHISCLTESGSNLDYTMHIHITGSDTHYILTLYRIHFKFTFTGSVRPSHVFLRVNDNHGNTINQTSKSGGGKTYSIKKSARVLQVYYDNNLVFTVNSLNTLFSKRLDAY